MITRKTLGAIALATTCLVPLAAFAQAPAITVGSTPFTGEIDFGLMGVMGNNPDQAGRYSGINTDGLDFVGNFDLLGRSPWNSGGTRYYELNGTNLVFQTGNKLGSGIGSDSSYASSTTNSLVNAGSLGFQAGDQGTWGVGAYYNSITYTGNVIDSIYTMNGSQGFLNNGLTPFGGATATKAGTILSTSYTTLPTGPTSLSSFMLPVQVGTRRDILGGDFKYIFGDWTFTGAFRHEHKEGSLEESFDGPYGGTAFALPIDYDTDRYDATAAYNTRLFQGILQYTFSHFTDNNLFVSLPYPTSNTAAPYQRTAAYSTPPSNSAQYVTLMLATNAVPETRINLNARVGVEKQDDSFAPNTGDPASVLSGVAGRTSLNPMLEGTSESSPDITATVYQLKVSAASHPLPNFDTRVYYGVDGRNVSLNQTEVYTGGTGGSAADALGAPTLGSSLFLVVPQDWLKQNAGAEVGYNIIPQYDTKLTVGYRLDTVDRSNAQVGHSWTNTGSIGLSSALGPEVNGRVSFDYSDRSGSLSYLTPWLNLDGPGATPTYSGAYYQAPMTSEAVTVRADYTPTDTLSGDVFLQFKNENYNYPGATNYTAPGSITPTLAPLSGVGGGVKQDYALTVGPDIDWRPTKSLNLHFFYTYELLFFNNLGNGNCSTSNTGVCAGSAGYFSNQDTSSTHTIGVSGDWKVNGKLKLRADYTVSYGSVMFAEFNGVLVSAACTGTAATSCSYQNVGNYPDINSLMNSLRLTATYEVMPNMELVGQVAYTQYHDNNWNDDAGPAVATTATTAIGYLTPGYGSPNYSVAMVMAGVKFKF